MQGSPNYLDHAEKHIRQATKYIRLVEDAILVTLLMIMILLAGFDILARSLFGGGVVWIPPILKIMVLWVGLLGALLATRTREHIAIDIVGRLAPFTLRQFLLVITSLFSAVVCLLIAWYSQEFVHFSKEFGDIAFARVPAWPLQIIIPISFLIMGIRFSIQTIIASLQVVKRLTPRTSIRKPE